MDPIVIHLIGIRIEIHIGLSKRVNASAGNNVSWEWIASFRVVNNRLASGRKISGTFGSRGNYGAEGQWVANASGLIIAKPEKLVFDNCAAQSSTKLVLFVRRFRVGCEFKRIARIEGRVPKEFKHISVILIRARLGDSIDNCSTTAAKFC